MAPENSAAGEPSPAFRPLSIRGCMIPNRVAIPPMCQYAAVDGMIGDWQLVHYGSRALGGAGLLITEATAVRPEGRISPACAGIWNDAQAEAWRRVVGFVHANSATKFGMQLAHGGRKASSRIPWTGRGPVPEAEGGWPVIGPSAVPWGEGWPVPRAVTRTDMDELRDAFVAAARRCEAIGFDLIELHMAHGYLLSSFLSPLANHRTDDYGGALANRARFPLEVLAAVRAAWPDDKPLFVRISATDWLDEQGQGFTADEAVRLARWLQDAGCDVLDVSTAGNSSTVMPPQAPQFQLPFAERIRAEVGIPVMAVGCLGGIEEVDAIVAAGRADLCAIGRGHLVDPAITLRAADERGEPGQFWPPRYSMARR